MTDTADVDTATRMAVAERAARAGAGVAHRAFRRGVDVELKDGKTDVVTQADRDAQARVIERIHEVYPDDPVVGEEEGAAKTVPETGPAWVVDPIDGTNNYVADVPIWGTAVAVVVDGEPVTAATEMPALGDTYTADAGSAYLDGVPVSVSDVTDPEAATASPTLWWDFDRRDEYARATAAIVERFGDLRRHGSAQATLAMVASGAIDAAVTNLQAYPWDSLAGVHLVRQAGGRVTDVRGDPWRHDSTGLVASNGEVHEAALATAQEIEGGS